MRHAAPTRKTHIDISTSDSQGIYDPRAKLKFQIDLSKLLYRILRKEYTRPKRKSRRESEERRVRQTSEVNINRAREVTGTRNKLRSPKMDVADADGSSYARKHFEEHFYCAHTTLSLPNML